MRKNIMPYILLATLLFFILSAFSLVEQREKLRSAEQKKRQLRDESILLRDERRNLQLEYVTHTNYNEVSSYAEKLGMITPTVNSTNFVYLPKEK